MPQPLSAPWLLRFAPAVLEVRLLVDERAAGGLSLTWRPHPGTQDERCAPVECRPLPMADHLVLARFIIRHYTGRGGAYRLNCGDRETVWLTIPPDPTPGESWRFLLLSDHQGHSDARRTLRAVDREAAADPFHGILFAGDLVADPDNPLSWAGAADGTAFFDSMATPAPELFTPHAERALLATTPILACGGNHDVSFVCDRPIMEEADGPGTHCSRRLSRDWDLAIFTHLFLPAVAPAPATPPGCYLVPFGPLQVLVLFVVRRWVPGDHAAATGPCYELPGRFICEPVAAGSRMLGWAQEQIAGSGMAGMPDHKAGKPLRVVMFHHPPYAQGVNAWPLFDEPLDYASNQIARHLVPLLEPWADLVLCGHNHVVNHHHIRGVHYFECSHMGHGSRPAARLPDGQAAPEPGGETSRFFAVEEAATYYAVLTVRPDSTGPAAEIRCRRVGPGGRAEDVYAFSL